MAEQGMHRLGIVTIPFQTIGKLFRIEAGDQSLDAIHPIANPKNLVSESIIEGRDKLEILIEQCSEFAHGAMNIVVAGRCSPPARIAGYVNSAGVRIERLSIRWM